MKTDDTSRREFLRRAAAGAGAVAGGALVPEAIAQAQEQHNDGAAMHMHPGGEGRGAFFNSADAATIAAFTERIMPGAPGIPGAKDAAVLNYIDLALAGAYSDLQDFYRAGLAQLDAHCRKSYGKAFSDLSPAQQDETLAALDEGKAAEFTWPTAQAFFNTVRMHTIEGMFADPLYGGNKDFAGWRLVGFPGAQAVFGPADMHSEKAFTRAPMIGLQSEA